MAHCDGVGVPRTIGHGVTRGAASENFFPLFSCPQPVGAVRAGGGGGDGGCAAGVPRGLHMSTRLHPPTCPQVVQIGVHTGVGRRPLRVPNVHPSCRRAPKLSVPGVSNHRTHVRSGGARRTPTSPRSGDAGAPARRWRNPVAVADDFSRPQATAPAYDRQPPQDIPAEQSVLGGMLLSKDAIADVVEALQGVDFYRPAHQVIFDCILDLYGRGEPADAITVAAELNRTDQLSKMGGAVYLHTLIASTPTAANAGYYAAIVAEQAVLRRLVEAGTRVVQLGYGAAGGKGDVDDIVDRAQQEIYDVTEKRM